MKKIIKPKGIVIHAMSEFIHRDGLRFYEGFESETETYRGIPLSQYPEWIKYSEWIPLIGYSVHGFMLMNGEFVQGTSMPPERADHAGKSYWRGLGFLNNHYLGIECIIPGQNLYEEFTNTIQNKSVYTDSLYLALVEKCYQWMQEFPEIEFENITRHSDVSPGRKIDPGRSFAWGMFKNLLGERLNPRTSV